MNIENLVMINFFGEGYYSGNTESHSMIVDKAFYEQYQNEINSYQPSSYELDGKHSDVSGDLSIEYITRDNLDHVVATVVEDDHYPVYEVLCDLCDDEKYVEDQYKIHETFESLCKVEVISCNILYA